MIDSMMLARLMVQTSDTPLPKSLLPLAQAIWAAAQAEQRETDAKICEAHTVDDVLVGVGIAQSCAAMIREGEK